MDERKRILLEANGWSVGEASEFLDLTPEETALIEVKLAVSKSNSLRQRRQQITHEQLAAEKRKAAPGDPGAAL